MLLTSTALVLGLIQIVTAHGGGQWYDIDGLLHRGNWDWLNNTEGSIQRSWQWDTFAVERSSLHSCGNTGEPGPKSYHAPHTAGSVISINYTNERYLWDDGRPWTFGHSHGPMTAYLARCPDDGCENADLGAPMWFKIFEAGLLEGRWYDGHWAMRDILYGANWDITTPKSLRPGKYLLRHEMVNLEGGAAQFFPNCVQLDISGDGDSFPGEEMLLQFPGAYANDEEISLVTQRGSEWFYTEHRDDTFYRAPGGPVWEG